MKIRERQADGELGEFTKIDPTSKTQEEIIEELQTQLADTRSQNADIIFAMVSNNLM